jgi:hypothetical protein
MCPRPNAPTSRRPITGFTAPRFNPAPPRPEEPNDEPRHTSLTNPFFHTNHLAASLVIAPAALTALSRRCSRRTARLAATLRAKGASQPEHPT